MSVQISYEKLGRFLKRHLYASNFEVAILEGTPHTEVETANFDLEFYDKNLGERIHELMEFIRNHDNVTWVKVNVIDKDDNYIDSLEFSE